MWGQIGHGSSAIVEDIYPDKIYLFEGLPFTLVQLPYVKYNSDSGYTVIPNHTVLNDTLGYTVEVSSDATNILIENEILDLSTVTDIVQGQPKSGVITLKATGLNKNINIEVYNPDEIEVVDYLCVKDREDYYLKGVKDGLSNQPIRSFIGEDIYLQVKLKWKDTNGVITNEKTLEGPLSSFVCLLDFDKCLLNAFENTEAINIYPLSDKVILDFDKIKINKQSHKVSLKVEQVGMSAKLISMNYSTDNKWRLSSLTSTQEENIQVLPKQIGSMSYVLVNEEDNLVYGCIDYVGDKEHNGEIVLFNTYEGLIDADDNIEIVYPCEIEGNTDIVNKCTFGCLFGTSNAKNRLFISGNVDKPNFDWHSGQRIDDLQGDYSYFSDDSYNRYGSEDNKLVGYSVISDGKLMVLKSPSDKESSVYYRTSSLTAVSDSIGNTYNVGSSVLYREVFPLVQTNSKIGGISQNLMTCFNGDTVFVADTKEIYGLDHTGSLYDNQKIASSRSLHIDREIRKIERPDLNCKLFTDGDALYYATPNYLYSTYIDRQYDWYKSDIKGICSNAHYKDEKEDIQLFGTRDGNIITFSDDKFYDITKTCLHSSTGGLLMVANDKHSFIINNLFEEDIKQADKISFERLDISYDLILTSEGVIDNTQSDFDEGIIANNVFKVGKYHFMGSLVDREDDNLYVRFERLDEEGLPFQKFIPHFEDSEGNIIIPSLMHDFCAKIILSNCELYISNLRKEDNKCKFSLLDISMGNIDGFLGAHLVKRRIVKSYYLTAPFSAGRLDSNKTIWAYSILSDIDQYNDIDIARISNEEDLDSIISPSVVASDFSFDDYSYSSLTFEQHKLPYTYTAYKPYSVGFICFFIKSDKPINSYLTGMQITYSIPSKTYGKN